MTNSIRSAPDMRLPSCTVANALPSTTKGRTFPGDDKDSPAKDARSAKKNLHDQPKSTSQEGARDSEQSLRLALFERKLQKAQSDNSDCSDDDEREPDGQTGQILYETIKVDQQKVAAPLSGLSPETEERAQRIFKEVAARIDAAIRPGPTIVSGPKTISIPLHRMDAGLTGIKITVDNSIVTVQLCFPKTSGDSESSYQLVNAASHLGQLLQSHLPGRRVRITRGTDASVDRVEERSPGSNQFASHPRLLDSLKREATDGY